MQNFVDFLKNKLQNELPGVDSQQIMTPKFKGKPFRNIVAGDDAKRSSVLLILEEQNSTNKFDIILTLRSSNLNKHSGQISFPGGRIDEGETEIDAAKRETFEEIGLESNYYEMIGKLSTLFVPPSNNIITPFIALLNSKPIYDANPDEVEEIFSVPIDNLVKNDSIKYYTDVFNGIEVEIPYFDVHPTTKLWGATSMILSELLVIYKEYLGKFETK